MRPREKRKEAAGRMKCIYIYSFFFQIAKNRTESHEASFVSARIMPNWKLHRVQKVTRRRVIHFWYAFLMQHCHMESIWLSMIHCLFIVKCHFFHRSLASQSHRHTTNKRVILRREIRMACDSRKIETRTAHTLQLQQQSKWNFSSANRLSLFNVVFSTMNFSKYIYFTFRFQFLRSFELDVYTHSFTVSTKICAQNINF